MATRRHRIVIKPNIRPAGAKISGTVTPKSKILPANAASEPPSPVIRPQQVPLSQEEKHQQSMKEEDGNVEAVSETETAKHFSKTTVDLLDKDVAGNAASKVTDEEHKVSSVLKESKSGAHNQGEVTDTRKEKSLPGTEEVSTDDVSDKVSSNLNATPLTNAENLSGNQRKNPNSSTPDVDNQALKSKDVTDCADIVKGADVDDDEATPSEADGSCMSETMSLDLDDERREEVGDKVQKKRRWHKSKKLRIEPLPSREKSPDRQKMKMSDLLAWNPQQNFLPKKKKRSPLKNDNRPLSPALSLTADDDKESTNESASLPAPQVMIGPDGSVILNTESLMIQTQKDDSRPKEILEDDDDDRYLNTNSYRKYKKTKQWTERETEKFFMGLSMCGTDFSLLTNLLPHRSRRELKNKFHREERRNRDLIDKALANRQKYSLAPFQQLAAEDHKKSKKEMKKQMKKEAVNEKTRKASKTKGRKRKKKESEEEEDDWCPEYDEEDEENQNNEDGSEKPVVVFLVPKRKSKMSKVKKELDNQLRPKSGDQNVPGFVPEEASSTPFMPGHSDSHVPHVPENLAAHVPLHAEYKDLDNPRMRNIPAKTYSRVNSENKTSQQQAVPSSAATNFSVSSVIQAIPGSTLVQIEMEGVQNLVQGVLIPSHMVPQIAPQLGIPGNAVGMQVLLVQDETESGSLVHVYVIPDGETIRGSGDNMGGGASGPGSHPAFSSPIPSPHPTSAIQSPHTVSPFPASPHPLASVCSPHSSSTFHSPPPLHDPAKRPFSQAYISSQQQNLNSQSASIKPCSDTSFTQQGQHNVGVGMSLQPPSAEEFSSSVSQNAPTVSHCISGIGGPDSSRNHCTQFSAGTNSASSHSVNTELLTHTTGVGVTHQTPDLLNSSETPVTSRTPSYNSDVVVAVIESTTVKDPVHNSEFEDDCIIVNSDRPQSQLDKSAMPCS